MTMDEVIDALEGVSEVLYPYCATDKKMCACRMVLLACVEALDGMEEGAEDGS